MSTPFSLAWQSAGSVWYPGRKIMVKVRSLECLRAVAALLVVLFHTSVIFRERAGVLAFGGAFDLGLRGVDLFFVLSGFIICYVHGGDFGNPRAFGKYLFARVARIYPAVIIATSMAVVIYAGGFGGLEKASKLQPWNVIASYALLPQYGPPLLNVTWTLKYEIFFYALFAIIILNRSAGLALVTLWQLLVAVFCSSAFHLPRLVDFYTNPLCLEFGLGMLCAWLIGALRRTNLTFVQTMAPPLLVLGIIAFLFGLKPGQSEAISSISCAVGAALSITCLAVIEQRSALQIPKILVALGGASFSIYLIHFSVITLTAVLLIRVHWTEYSNSVLLFVAALSVAAGMAFHSFVDQPIQRFLRRRRPRGAADEGPSFEAVANSNDALSPAKNDSNG